VGICSKNRRKWLKSPKKWLYGRFNILPASQKCQQQQNLHVLTVVNRIYSRKQQSAEREKEYFGKIGKKFMGDRCAICHTP
jgi:mono/diheme cytochrome c family protein